MDDYDPNAPLWSIMTKSHGGTVSVIRGLTLEEARKTYERLDPWYGSVSYIDRAEEERTRKWNEEHASSGAIMLASFSTHGRSISDGDIDIREVFGPAGWTTADMASWQHWPRRATEEEQAVHDKWQEADRERRTAQVHQPEAKAKRSWL